MASLVDLKSPFEFLGSDPFFSDGPNGLGQITLCQSSSLFIAQQRMMVVDWRWQIQQMLQKSMQVSCFEEIFATCNEVHVLESIIVNHGKMVTAADIFSNKHDIA